MGRHKVEKIYAKVGFYVKPEQRDYIQSRAAKEDRSPSSVMREILDEVMSKEAGE